MSSAKSCTKTELFLFFALLNYHNCYNDDNDKCYVSKVFCSWDLKKVETNWNVFLHSHQSQKENGIENQVFQFLRVTLENSYPYYHQLSQ